MAWFAWFETLADASPHHDSIEWAAKILVMVRSGPSGPRLEPRKDQPTLGPAGIHPACNLHVDQAPAAMIGLLNGADSGKMLVKLAG